MFFQQDTVIFERLQDKQMYMDSTVEHLEEFAKEGKRTTSTFFVQSSSVSPNSSRLSHVSWRKEVLCYLGTVTQIAGSVNPLRRNLAWNNRTTQIFSCVKLL